MRAFIPLLCLLFWAPLSSSCSTPDAPEPAAAAAPEALTIYSGRSERLVGPILERFQEAHPSWDISIRYAKTGALAATLVEEGPGTRADIFLSQEASTLAMLASQGMFATLPDALLQRVPAEARGDTGHWVGLSGRARVLTYNTELVSADQLPATLDELTDERWRGRLGWAPENGSFQSFVVALVQERGAEGAQQWLEAVAALEPRAYPSNTPSVVATEAGEVHAVLTNHYYLHRLKAEHGEGFAAANHYFDAGRAGALVNLTGAAILSQAGADPTRRAAAEALIGYLLSDQSQAAFATETFELPMVASVAPVEGVPADARSRAPQVDFNQLGDLEGAEQVLRQAGVLP